MVVIAHPLLVEIQGSKVIPLYILSSDLRSTKVCPNLDSHDQSNQFIYIF